MQLMITIDPQNCFDEQINHGFRLSYGTRSSQFDKDVIFLDIQIKVKRKQKRQNKTKSRQNMLMLVGKAVMFLFLFFFLIALPNHCLYILAC